MNSDVCILKTDKSGLELTEHGNIAFPIGHYSDNLQKLSVNWHWHEELELIIILEGTAIIAGDSERHIVNAGDGFFVNSGVLHGIWNFEDSICRMHSIVIHPRLIGGNSDSIFWTKYLNPIIKNTTFKYLFLNHNISWHKKIIDTIDKTWLLCDSMNNGYEFKIRNILSELIFILYNNIDFEDIIISEKKMRDSLRIKDMLQYINLHYSENITIKQIANSASISESECLRCFHSTIDTTPIQYLKSFRIKKATEILLTTNLKITDIGIICGFQDMSYFAKAFYKVYGKTPSEYRNS